MIIIHSARTAGRRLPAPPYAAHTYSSSYCVAVSVFDCVLPVLCEKRLTHSWTYFHCVTQIKELWFKTDSKPSRIIFLFRTAPIPNEFFDIPVWTVFWKSIKETPNIANILFVNDIFKFFLHRVLRPEFYCNLVFCLIVICVSDYFSCIIILQH